MNIFKGGIDETFIYDVLYKRNHQFVIKRIIDNKQKIIEYYESVQEKDIDIDSFIDYIMAKYIISIEDDSGKLEELKENIQEILIAKYQSKKIVKFVEKHYLNISNLTSDTKEQIIATNQMIIEIGNRNIKNVNIEKIFKQYSVIFFDNVRLFYKKNKNTILKLLTFDNIMNDLIAHRINNLFEFIRIHSKEIKESKYYNKIILCVKESIKGSPDIYKKEKNYLQYIYLLEDLKDKNIVNEKKQYETIQKEAYDFLQKNGIKYENKIDLTDSFKQLEKKMKDDKSDSRIKIIQCFVRKTRNKFEILLNDIDRVQPPLTDILMGNSHSYYRPFKKMCFESIYLSTSMNAFCHIYLKYCGYHELENTLSDLFRDVYQYVLFEEENITLYKQEAENVVNTIKNFMNNKSKYTSYVDVFYISSVLERVMRKIFINTCLDNNAYIGDVTLKDIFDEKFNNNLRIIIGESLYMWLKYYLYHDKEVKNGFIIKEGIDIRNTICHGKYRVTDDLSKIYYILIYLLMNLLWSIDLRMIVYPTNRTERILIKSFKNSI